MCQAQVSWKQDARSLNVGGLATFWLLIFWLALCILLLVSDAPPPDLAY